MAASVVVVAGCDTSKKAAANGSSFDGFFHGVRLRRGGCQLPDGRDQGAGAAGIEGDDVPNPMFAP